MEERVWDTGMWQRALFKSDDSIQHLIVNIIIVNIIIFIPAFLQVYNSSQSFAYNLFRRLKQLICKEVWNICMWKNVIWNSFFSLVIYHVSILIWTFLKKNSEWCLCSAVAFSQCKSVSFVYSICKNNILSDCISKL